MQASRSERLILAYRPCFAQLLKAAHSLLRIVTSWLSGALSKSRPVKVTCNRAYTRQRCKVKQSKFQFANMLRVDNCGGTLAHLNSVLFIDHWVGRATWHMSYCHLKFFAVFEIEADLVGLLSRG